MGTPPALIARLYRGLDGFTDTGTAPNGGKLRPAKALVYGELTTTGTRQLITAAGLADGDVFIDLGSGIGKVALQVALSLPGVRSIGIEIARSRHAQACEALRRAVARGWIAPERCEFRHGDVRDADFGEATVVFANSTCFPPRLRRALVRRLAALRRPMTFVTLRKVSGPTAGLLDFVATARCETSWDVNHQMHVYRLRGDK